MNQKKSKNIVKCKRGDINHSLDVFNQDIQEDENRLNLNTILMVDIGQKLNSNISKNEYRVICKIGYGGFSVVWLVIDTKSKIFKVMKVFKYGVSVYPEEIKILRETSYHPNILRYYESFPVSSGRNLACVAAYEPLGKNLVTLVNDASEYDGLSISVVKKVAKHVLTALQTIHKLKIIHCDVKLDNIATCVSQLSLRRQLEHIVVSGKSLSSLRMECLKKYYFDERKARKLLKEELDGIPKLDTDESTELIFKLIDFGNVQRQGKVGINGTHGFHSPEYFFGAPFLPSHDIWALGVTLIELLSDDGFFDFGDSNREKADEIIALRNMFGKFSRRHYKKFIAFKNVKLFKKVFNKDPPKKEIFTTKTYDSKKVEEQIKKFLRHKINGHRMVENDRNELIDFLFYMLNTIPSERKSAEELLSHPWLNETKISEIARLDGHEYESNAIGKQSGKIRIPLVSLDPKLFENGDKAIEKTKKATKKNPKLISDSFIHQENDGRYYLYHKYWRVPYRQDRNLFQCPKCQKSISLEAKIGFVIVSDQNWHKSNCKIRRNYAPSKGYNPSKEEVDRKREMLEKVGYKRNVKKTSSNESEDETDSSIHEIDEDSNKTISEFGPGERYVKRSAETPICYDLKTGELDVEAEAEMALNQRNLYKVGLGQINEVNWSNISSDSME